MGVWRLDSDQFAALWLGDANEFFPDPLVYTSRFRFLDEWGVFRARTRLEHSVAEFDGLHRALAMMTGAKVSVRVVGAAPGRVVTVRMLGCRDDAAAVVVSQLPATGRASGDLVLRTGMADELAVMLARSMPPARPGHKPGGRFYRSDIEPGSQLMLTRVMGKSPGELYRDITDTPRTLSVSVEGRYGPGWAASEPVSSFDVLDVEADGRYASHGDDPIVIAPADAPELAKLFRTTIARAAEAAESGSRLG